MWEELPELTSYQLSSTSKVDCGHGGLEPHSYALPWISLRCTNSPRGHRAPRAQISPAREPTGLPLGMPELRPGPDPSTARGWGRVESGRCCSRPARRRPARSLGSAHVPHIAPDQLTRACLSDRPVGALVHRHRPSAAAVKVTALRPFSAPIRPDAASATSSAHGTNREQMTLLLT